MESNWKNVNLGNYAKITMGQSPESQFYNEELNGIPFLQGSKTFGDIFPKIEKYTTKTTKLASENSIIFSVRAPVGDVNIAPTELCIGRGLAALESRNNRFLYYLLKFNKFKYESYSSGTVFSSINKKSLETMIVRIPNEKNQDKIAEILWNLDSKIELNNQIISNLEELASTLFKRWFVEFEFPDENGNPYKSSGGKMVDSEFGEVPEGWDATSLSDIANYKNGLAMQKFRPDEDEKSLPVLKIKELNQGFTDSNSDRCSIDISDEVKIENGDVVFSWSGTLLVKIWTGGDAGLNQHLFKVTSNKFPKWYYYLWTKFYMNKFIGIAKDKATTMGHIKRQHLNEAKVLIPSINMLEKFGKVLSPTINTVTEKGIENLELSNLRDSLLPKLLSGEIELPEDEEV
ncbi:restriction endonuclease subunit S [Enterococcus sp. B1E4]|uniref:restriction endonuclease subunit S n=1 Tax=unclassified Enterococcus TaxID=2608891 RepID=UPI00265BFB24|nr:MULTISPECIES: restriction endonuclease subunit S [unclassified Enterococcus]MDO0896409.1 restriction endonuclease subunit S [Enterococcus sp. B1E4]MDO0909175.1 restriction endonuclease subunit S [Enterococcus sp. B2E4]